MTRTEAALIVACLKKDFPDSAMYFHNEYLYRTELRDPEAFSKLCGYRPPVPPANPVIYSPGGVRNMIDAAPTA